MFKLSAYYPHSESAQFDFAYYREQHFPLVLELLGPYGAERFEIDRGIPGIDGNSPHYIAMGHLYVADPTRLGAGLAEHGERILADVANYTNVTPVLQLNALA